MSDSDWVDDPHSGDGWVDDHPEEKPGSAESAARGFAQGATAGFADEATGGLQALWDKAIKGDPAALADLYRQHRDESRANYAAAKDANPTTYDASQIGGAIGTSLIPGLGEANLAKLGLQGAAQGLGSSQADLTKGDYAGALKDTAIGGGTGLLIGGAAKALPMAGNAIKNGLEDVATAPFGTAGEMGIASKGINAIGNAGKAINETTGSAIKGLGGTGNDVADKLVDQVLKKGSYALPVVGKLQAGVDLASAAPAIAQKTAQLALKGVDKLGNLAPSLGALSTGATSVASTSSQKFEPQQIVQKAQGTKYASVLQNASQRGPEALRAANFILQGQDPEYRKLMIGDEDRQKDESFDE